jgi:hypothetical protein
VTAGWERAGTLGILGGATQESSLAAGWLRGTVGRL